MKHIDRIVQLIRSQPDPWANVGAISDQMSEWMKELGNEDLSYEILHAVEQSQIGIDEGTMILQIAAWTGNDGGAGMFDTFSTWLREGTDENKVRLALGAEVLLFNSTDEGQNVYAALLGRFPRLDTEIGCKLNKYRRA